MIVLQSDKFQLDLSKYGIATRELNQIFHDTVDKGYSLPFNIVADAILLEQLELAHLDNIQNTTIRYKCHLLLPEKTYDAILYIKEVEGYNIHCNLTFGDAILDVYSTKLKDLPWKLQLAEDLNDFAQDVIENSWPDVGYNFPMVYYPDIVKGSNYDHFLGFVNNFESGAFIENDIGSGEEPGVINRNVMVPFPYFAEILKFGYETNGYIVHGTLFENEDFKKAVYIPKNYLEKLDASQYAQFSFGLRDSVTQLNGQTLNVYEYNLVTEEVGSFKVSFKINLSPLLAETFILNIYKEDSFTSDRTLIQNYTSSLNRVDLEEEVSVVLEPSELGDKIVVELMLKYTNVNISEFNSFEIARADGQVNVFPNVFSLSDFMPDMTFGEYVTAIKNWLNLEVTRFKNVVFINFIQDSIYSKPKRDHQHLEQIKPKRKINGHRFFKLKYANNDSVFYNKDGQVFSDLESDGVDDIEINMEVVPAIVEMNSNTMTAIAPEEDDKLRFCMYDGTMSGIPLCNPAISQNLSIQNVFKNFWETWLGFRVNSFTFNETFECSIHEIITVEELSYKYNELHIIKSLNKKILSESTMRVEVETETF